MTTLLREAAALAALALFFVSAAIWAEEIIKVMQ